MSHAGKAHRAYVASYRAHRQSRPGAAELMTRIGRYHERCDLAIQRSMRRFRETMSDGRF